MPLVGVLTDFGAHDYWAQPGIDRYCVPHEYDRGSTARRPGSSDAGKIVATGVPLCRASSRCPSAPLRAADRPRTDRDPRPVVLVLGGGLGIGVDDIVAPLCREVGDCHLVVMAGRNDDARERLRGLLRRGASRRPTARRSRYTAGPTTWNGYLVAADVVVGKSGGLTVAEVLACGRPLLVTHTLQGQESFNVRFLERLGIGRLVGNDGLAPQVREWLASPELLQVIQQQARAAGRRDGAVRVAEEVLELVATRAPHVARRSVP